MLFPCYGCCDKADSFHTWHIELRLLALESQHAWLDNDALLSRTGPWEATVIAAFVEFGTSCCHGTSFAPLLYLSKGTATAAVAERGVCVSGLVRSMSLPF